MKKLLYLIITLYACVAVPDTGKTAIASAHPLATYAGFEILQQGGNVFDAAVAVSAALAVVEPAGSGLGGGGFWLLHRQHDGFETMIDGREKAPIAAARNMYINASGKVEKRLSKDGALAAAIPGMPAALVHIASQYGNLPLSESLKPAIRYARQGFKIGERHHRLLMYRKKLLQQFPESARIFLANGKVPQSGTLLRQPDLANTLERLAKYGRAGFYQGETAQRLVQAVQEAGGIWTLEDLRQYRVIEREPIKGTYKNIKISSAAPPSSGGLVLLETLNILSAYDLTAVNDITRKHLIVEALRHAYHDRARYLGDADFVDIPIKRLLSLDYAAGLRASIRLDRALPSQALAATWTEPPQGRNTTHFSIMDEQGNRVAATLSINFPFGSGLVARGTGVLLNDEMDDFVVQSGILNGYGLTGGAANAIAPEKRMLSSMTPTFLEDKDRIAVLGTPGGSRIISMVLLAVLDFAEAHKPQSWVNLPRFHHQYIPDEIQYEPGGLDATSIQQLTGLGHKLRKIRYRYGNMQAVQLDKKNHRLSAASDPRGEGWAIIR